MSLPLAEGATETLGCVWMPFSEFQRCELRLRLSVFELLIVTSTLPRPTLLLPSRGERMFSPWKNASVAAQLAAGAVHADVKNVALEGVAKIGKLRSC